MRCAHTATRWRLRTAEAAALMSPSWTVPPAEQGERLDRALARHLALPRNQIQGWIHGGHVRVQGVAAKPAGLTVHPGAGRRGGTLANRLLARFPEVAGVGGPGRPGIVHRLDRGTS